MTNEQKYKIESAIVEFQLSCEMFFTKAWHRKGEDVSIEYLKTLHNALVASKNKLYDAIGGMEDCKYPLDED